MEGGVTMKKKVISLILSTILAASVLAGCGGGSADSTGGDAAAAGETAAAEEEAVSDTAGDPNGTHLDLWTFVELHGTFYRDMVEQWNQENPDKTIELTTITYPYSDMHNKLLMSFQAGTGAPDICDVEVGQFPNVVAYQDQALHPLNDVIAPYEANVVKSRIETYQGADGNDYGVPFHVGATLMYYNLAELEAAGITKEEVDAIKTWDDYEALGKKYVEARGNDGTHFWTSVDTSGTDILWVAMAEYGEDWTGGFEGPANVQLESVKNMLTYEKRWVDEGIAQITKGGQIDTEDGFQSILSKEVVAFPKAAWFMSRFLNYMEEEEGNWYLAPCPVFEEGQPNSVGIGGTGTVVTTQSENPELAAEFIAWAKMGEAGEKYIWENLGFDVCNTSLWNQDDFAHDESNKYNTFFRNYPYDVLYQIKDNIGKISVVAISPTINDQINLTTLNDIFENGADIETALQDAQDAIDIEQ